MTVVSSVFSLVVPKAYVWATEIFLFCNLSSFNVQHCARQGKEKLIPTRVIELLASHLKEILIYLLFLKISWENVCCQVLKSMLQIRRSLVSAGYVTVTLEMTCSELVIVWTFSVRLIIKWNNSEQHLYYPVTSLWWGFLLSVRHDMC